MPVFNKAESEKLFRLKPIQKYKEIMIDSLRSEYPLLNLDELSEAIDWAVINNVQNHPIKFDNNYTKQTMNGTLLDILTYIQKLEPILTSSGVLFKKHKEAKNPLSDMIMGFIKQRKVYKKKMFTFPKGSADFEKYNLLQLLEKLNANATYGVLGSNVSHFYNIYIASTVTSNGRAYITQSIMLFESLLANNIKFNSLNEIITFIYNICSEKDKRKFDDSLILTENISTEQCFFKIMNTVDPLIWLPTEKEMMLVWNRIQALSQEDKNRVYYKNMLYEFCNLPIITDLIIKILTTLDKPFMNPNEPPECIKSDLDVLTSFIKEYVYYGYTYIDKMDRVEYMQRDIVAIVDTDSTIISFDAWYRFILDKVYNIDMPIKHEKFKLYNLVKSDEFGDKPKNQLYELVEPILDYDFYTDEVIEIERLKVPCTVIPQDSLRYSIINIIAYVCSNLVVDYLDRYCTSANSNQETVPCYMVMKNEFLFASALVTDAKKNYANVQDLQEGNVIPNNKKARMAIMGLN